MQNKFARTDLAAEAVGRLDRAPEGVFADTLSLHGCEVSRVVISSEAGAEALGKPMGKYLTLEMADYVTRRGQSFPDCAAALRDLLKSFEAVERAQSFLIACLGNRAVTPDAVGPLTADGIIVTRHLKSSLPQDFAAFSSVSVVRPGVLGTTGIESAQTIRSMCELVRPDCVIAVDALASGEMRQALPQHSALRHGNFPRQRRRQRPRRVKRGLPRLPGDRRRRSDGRRCRGAQRQR